jgi:hypothetical protein
MGGTSGGPTGNGTLNVTDSTINVIAPTAVARIGFNGTAQATLTNSTLNVGGGAVTIASQPGSTGTLTLNAGSVINTTYVGVGTPSQGVLTGGGNGTLIVRAGATVNGDSPQAVFELGATSLLKGTGELNFREGNVIIGGTVDPGDSPGRLRINCNLVSLDGSRLILEVQSSGTGYNVDQLVIGDDSTFDLKQFQIAFTFLDATDPTAFAASGGFDLDNFLKAGRFDANGNSLPASSDDPLSAIFAAGQTWADVVDGTKITAVSSAFNITSLSLDGATGSFNVAVAPIPEPSTWALMLAGLVIIGARAKRQRRDSSALLPRGPAIACS